MNNKSIFFLSIFSVALYSCDLFSVGSYPYREEYVFNECSEKELIADLENLKKEYPDLSLSRHPEFKDSYTDSRKLWYSFYFQNVNTGTIFKTIIQEKNKNETIVGLVSICDIQDLYNWKEVNHDLKGDSDRNVKLEFENIVLSKLKKKYRKRTFWENVGIK